MAASGFNNTTLKQSNRGLILRLVATGECGTRIELARKTGLSKMAATNIIGEFIEAGILEEGGKQHITGKGRNPVMLSVADSAPKIVAVHLFRDDWCVALRDITLKTLYSLSFPVNKETAPRLMENLYHTIDKVMEFAANRHEKLFGISVGSIGPVDVDRGMILNPPNFFGIRDLPVVELLKERYDMPVSFDSQYNCAALMEKYFGCCRDVEDFVFLGISNGIGSGVISNGKLLRNAYGMTSEIGHISIDWNGRICGCGNRGCIEAYSSVPVMEKTIREVTGRTLGFQELCRLEEARLAGKEPEGTKEPAFTQEEGAAVSEVFETFTRSLAVGITNVVNTLNPQKIIIGHHGYWVPDHYVAQMEQMVNDHKMTSQEKKVSVEKSRFEDMTQRYGCACALLTRVFDGEMASVQIS